MTSKSYQTAKFEDSRSSIQQAITNPSISRTCKAQSSKGFTNIDKYLDLTTVLHGVQDVNAIFNFLEPRPENNERFSISLGLGRGWLLR